MALAGDFRLAQKNGFPRVFWDSGVTYTPDMDGQGAAWSDAMTAFHRVTIGHRRKPEMYASAIVKIADSLGLKPGDVRLGTKTEWQRGEHPPFIMKGLELSKVVGGVCALRR